MYTENKTLHVPVIVIIIIIIILSTVEARRPISHSKLVNTEYKQVALHMSLGMYMHKVCLTHVSIISGGGYMQCRCWEDGKAYQTRSMI